MFAGLVRWTDRSVSESISKRCVALAIYCLVTYLPGDDVDEIVDFTHKGGWDRIDTVLCNHSGFEFIFRSWDVATYWAKNLVKAAKVLKVSTSPLLRREELTLASCLQERQPDSEAGETMCKFAEKWKNIAQESLDELYGDDETTDSSAESNNESSAESNDEYSAESNDEYSDSDPD
jgi:hypothetical protein